MHSYIMRLCALVGFLAVGAALPPRVAAQEQTGSVRGQVTDGTTARPLTGVNVFVPGTNLGALTDDRGMYLLLNVPAGRVTLRAQVLGYGTIDQEVTVVAGQAAVADFALGQTAIALDEVVVTATGETRKREVGNAVSTINVAEVPTPSLRGTQDLITARSTGVSVYANSGQPGAGGTIRLRGNNSVTQGNNPIIYVDGVRIYNGSTPTNLYARQSASPLQDINSADIDRIEIVKGPAATTLYGTEASGGVIQIFTKKGRQSAPVWNAEIAGGFNNMGHVGPESDPTGLFVNRCRGSDLVNGAGVVFEDATCPESGSWLRNGPIQRYSLSVRGGGTELSYYLSGHYGDEQGVIQTAQSTDGGFRGTFSFQPTEAIAFSLSNSYTKRNTNWVPDGNNASGFLLNASRGPNSNFKGEGCSSAADVCVRNADLFEQESTTNTDHFVSGLTVNYTPRANFSNRLSVGYDFNRAIIETIIPFDYPRVPLGQFHWRDWGRTLITVDFASTLRHELTGSVASNVSFGGQLFDSRLANTGVEARDFSGPGKPTITNAAVRNVTGDTRQRVVNAGLFFQEMVSWNDRLFVTGGLRVDGNSAFGENFGLQPYPKVSASYVLSDHDFWPVGLVETMKLRGAIGDAGKAPGAFDAVKTWTSVAGDEGQPGFTPEQIGNPDLGPERTREIELGFEASALEGRVGVDFTYYNQTTQDALLNIAHPPSNGFTSRQLENVGELQNNGIELRLDAGLVRTQTVDWRARFNFTTVNSEAIDLAGEVLPIMTLARTFVKEGLPVPAYIGKKILNPNEFADPVIEEDAYLGSSLPEKIIGLSTNVTLWNRVTLDAVGEFQRGGHLLNAVGYQNANLRIWQPCFDVQAKMTAFADGDANALDDVTALERARCTRDRNLRDYDWWVEATDFFKLRSVSVSYQLPENLIPGLGSAMLTLAGRNLITSTDYTGTDPEVSDIRDNSFARRDYYNFPTSRSFLASLRVTF